MSRHRTQGGWLLYAGQLGVIAADVLGADMSMCSSSLDVTSVTSPSRALFHVTRAISFTAQLAGKFDWAQNCETPEPPHLGALLALARNHPDEYRRWREAEAVLEALGG